MNIGTHTRSAHDNRTVAVDFTAESDFDATPITSATVTVVAVAGHTLARSSVSVAANVVTFRLSGGAAGDVDEVTVTATNGVDTMCVSIAVNTLSC